jgi:hypothetical protein
MDYVYTRIQLLLPGATTGRCEQSVGIWQWSEAHCSASRGRPPPSTESSDSLCMVLACLQGWMPRARTLLCGNRATVAVFLAYASLMSWKICDMQKDAVHWMHKHGITLSCRNDVSMAARST